MKSVPDLWFEALPWIDGRSSACRESFPVINPATGQEIAIVGRVDADLVNQAIEGAVQAQKEWKHVSNADRGNVLKRAASLLLERKDELARLLTAEQGKTYAQAIGEVEYAASFFQWFGEESRRIYGRIVPHPDSDREFLIEQKPIGVAGLITPWNFPLAQGAKKIAAALAAGCAAVWKPAERTPLIALAAASVLRDAGVPDGVLQVVPGSGELVGRVMTEHPAIGVVSLTGSTATGSALMSSAAKGIKRVALELGGNAPFVVLPDADLEFTAEQLVRLKLLVSGQVCVTANRVFVHAEMERDFLDLIAQKLQSAKVGNGLDEEIDAGPLIHQKACDEIGAMVDSATRAGARIVARNAQYERQSSLRFGSFFPPTLLTDVHDEMTIATREVFGPVISVLSYRHLGEVIARANATPYGLAAYVYGADLSQCQAVARQLEVGIVGVNEWRPLKAEIPFGGIKQSGIGAEGGEEGLREFLNTQVVSIPKPTLPPPHLG